MPPPAVIWRVTGPGPEPKFKAMTPSEDGSDGACSSPIFDETLMSLSRAAPINRSNEAKRVWGRAAKVTHWLPSTRAHRE